MFVGSSVISCCLAATILSAGVERYSFGDSGEVKGAFWIMEKLTGRQELWLFFENDKAVMLSIKRYIGTSHTYKVQTLRFDDTAAQ
jgi:hypothetical protein